MRLLVKAPILAFVSAAVAQSLWLLGRWPGRAVEFLGLFLAGALSWSLLEYFFHRVLFHMPLDRGIWSLAARHMHWQHHERPNDPDEVMASPWLTVPLYTLFTAAFAWLSGDGARGLAWGAGLAAGYAAYEWVHFAVHFHSRRDPLFLYLRRHHFWHHFKDKTNRFGVTSPLWDFVFGTLK